MAGPVLAAAGRFAQAIAVRKIATGMSVGDTIKSELFSRAITGMGSFAQQRARVFKKDDPAVQEEKSPEPAKIQAKPITSKEDGEALKDHSNQLVTGLEKVHTSATVGFTKATNSVDTTGDKISKGIERIADTVARKRAVPVSAPHWINQPRDEKGRFKKKDDGLLTSLLPFLPLLKGAGILGVLGSAASKGYEVYSKTKNPGKAFVAGASRLSAVGAAGYYGSLLGEKIAKEGKGWLQGMFKGSAKPKKDSEILVHTKSLFEADRSITFEVENTVTFKEAGSSLFTPSPTAKPASSDKPSTEKKPGEKSSFPIPIITPLKKLWNAITGGGDESSSASGIGGVGVGGVGGVGGGVGGGGGGGGGGGFSDASPAVGGSSYSGPRQSRVQSPTRNSSAAASSSSLIPNSIDTGIDRNDAFGKMPNTPRRYERQRGERGEFNYALTSEGQKELGVPGQAKIVPIKTLSGKTFQVNEKTAQPMQDFVHEAERRGYHIRDIGGYSYRQKAGGGGLSTHASGTTMDINPGQNAMDGQNRTDMPPNMEKLGWLMGLSSGYKFGDAMHFERMSPDLWHRRLDQLVKEGFINEDQASRIKKGERATEVMGWTSSPNVQEQAKTITPEQIKKDEDAARMKALESPANPFLGSRRTPTENGGPLFTPTAPPRAYTGPAHLLPPSLTGGTDLRGKSMELDGAKKALEGAFDDDKKPSSTQKISNKDSAGDSEKKAEPETTQPTFTEQLGVGLND